MKIIAIYGPHENKDYFYLIPALELIIKENKINIKKSIDFTKNSNDNI